MAQALSSAPPPAKAPTPGAGLEGVVAAKSEICFIDGVGGRLVYRGYEIGDLVENASFEDVAHLLWDGKLPNQAQLAQLKKDIAANMALPNGMAAIRATIAALPLVKVVSLGVGGDDADVLACAEAGAVGYVPREGTLDDLLAVIDSAVRTG